jgi:hypothetical protein
VKSLLDECLGRMLRGGGRTAEAAIPPASRNRGQRRGWSDAAQAASARRIGCGGRHGRSNGELATIACRERERRPSGAGCCRWIGAVIDDGRNLSVTSGRWCPRSAVIGRGESRAMRAGAIDWGSIEGQAGRGGEGPREAGRTETAQPGRANQ